MRPGDKRTRLTTDGDSTPGPESSERCMPSTGIWGSSVVRDGTLSCKPSLGNRDPSVGRYLGRAFSIVVAANLVARRDIRGSGGENSHPTKIYGNMSIRPKNDGDV